MARESDFDNNPSEDFVTERIENCVWDFRGSLDLSHLALRSIPEEVRKLSHLTSLDLSNNQLDELPEWLEELKELRYLSVGHNNLQSLPACLEASRSLETLILSNNAGIDLPTSLVETRNASEIIRYYFGTLGSKGEPLLELKLDRWPGRSREN